MLRGTLKVTAESVRISMRQWVSPILRCKGATTSPRGDSVGVATILSALVAFLGLSILSPKVLAQDPADLVKGAYLPKFLSFIHWPNGDDEKLICILGRNPFGRSVQEFVRVEGIRARVVAVADEDDIAPCHLLYVSSSESSRLDAILTKAADMRVLTVSDIEGFVERGGTIELTVRRNRVRFIINREDAEKKGIEISAQLLLLSRKHES